MTIETKIARGVAFLDAAVKDWRSRIDLDELDLSDPQYCVLGQVFRHDPDRRTVSAFSYGTWQIHDHLGLGDDEYVSPSFFGFDNVSDDDITYDELTDLWANEVSRG